jgi:pimeloyl-ACP methyl ester carboxylesterase
VNFVHQGSGAPPLAFAHGFGCSLEDWRTQLAFFCVSHEVLACDLRGHGATPGRAHECSIAHYGGDVAALLNHLNLKNCVLVGHSLGCRVVLEAARLDPERVGGLVLIDGSRLATGDPDAAEAAARAAIAAAGYPAFAEALFRGMFLAPSPQADAIVARGTLLPPDAGTALWCSLVRWDAEHMDAALTGVRAPLMVIQSTYLDPSRQRRSLQPGQSTPWLDLVRARVPTARIEIVPGVGHFTQLEAPAKVNRLLAQAAVHRS